MKAHEEGGISREMFGFKKAIRTFNKIELSNRAISPRNVSLLNFDSNDRRMCFLTSPRSSEACLRMGIDEYELLVKTRNDILVEGIPQQFRDQVEEFIQLKLAFYEALRQKRVEKCIEMRNKIIEEKKAADKQAHAENLSNERQNEYSGETEHGFHFWKNKQVNELDFIVENANKYTEIQLKHQNAESNFKRISEEKRLYYENKNRAFSAVRARWVKEKEEEKEKIEFVRQSFELKKADYENKWKEKQDYLVQIRSNEVKKKEIERREKKERARSRVLSSEQKKQQEVDMKKKLMELKYQQVQKIMDNKKDKISEKMKEKQKIFGQKLTEISELHESRRNIMWNKYTQRMKKSEDQRQRIQEDKFKAIDLKKVQNIVKAREMRQSWVTQTTELSSRYTSSPGNETDFDVEALLKKEKWRHQHNRVESGIDARIQEKLSRQADILEIKRRNVLKSMETKATRAEVQRSALMNSNKQNQMIQFLKEQEARAHSARKEKADKYHNEELLQKLTLKNLTLREKAIEKERQMVQRAKFSKDVASEKYKLGEMFQKAKMHAARETFRSSHMNSARHSAFHTTCTETFLTEFNEVKKAVAENPIIKSRSRNSVQSKKLNSSLIEWPSTKEKGLPYFLNVTNGNFGFMKLGRKYSQNKVRQSFDMSSSKEDLSSMSHPKNYRHSALPSNRAGENSADTSMTKEIVKMYLDPTSASHKKAQTEVILKSEETKNALLAGNESNLTEVKN